LLFRNLKSLGKITHITLVGIWILCIIIISTLAIKRELEVSVDAEYVEVKSLTLEQSDTLHIRMNTNLLYTDDFNKTRSQKIVKDEEDNSRLFSTNVNMNFRTSNDDELKVRVTKKGFGSTETIAREKAALIDYNYTEDNSTLKLDNYFLTTPEFSEQNLRVDVTVNIPEDRIVYLDKSLMKFSRIRNFKSSDYNTYLGYTDNVWKPLDNITKTDSISTNN